MKRFCLYIIILITVLIFSGCGKYGFIYTHVTTPLDTNMSNTPIVTKGAEGNIQHLVLIIHPVLQFSWDTAAIGEIAKKNGLETVYYADLEEERILGLYNIYTVHIYGK